uniref:Uncharacterized protein n=1 Tax=Anguilla anguilla TaxID=7936 RepID=A0A0E9XMN6_ANGAN
MSCLKAFSENAFLRHA